MENEVKVRVYTVERGVVRSGALAQRDGVEYFFELGGACTGDEEVVERAKLVFRERVEGGKRAIEVSLEELADGGEVVGRDAVLVFSDGWSTKAVSVLRAGDEVVAGYGREYWRYRNDGLEVGAERCRRKPAVVDLRL
jgi:hypothetical protein